MSELVIVSFASEADAANALGQLRHVEKAGQLKLEDTAVVSKDAAGEVTTKNELGSGTETGAVVGGVLGLMTSFIFPVVGTLLGAAAGGWIGGKFREGVDQGFVRDVSNQLEPGTSALFLIVREWNLAAVSAGVAGHRGEILHTTLSDDLVASLRQSLAGPA